MKWTDFLINLVSLIAVVYFFSQSLTARMDSLETNMRDDIRDIKDSIKSLSDTIQADRRATT